MSDMPPGWLPPGMSQQVFDSLVPEGSDPDAFREQMWSMSQSSSTTSSTLTPMVRMGGGPTTIKAAPVLSPSGGLIPQSGTTTVKAQPYTVDQAVASFYAWTPEQLKENMKKMRDAGFTVTSPTQAFSVWQTMVQGAAQSNLAKQMNVPGAKSMTPWQALDFLSTNSGPDDGDMNNDGIADKGSDTKTVTSSQVTKYSPSDIRSAAEQTYIDQLGRAPTRGERKALRSAINQMSEQNPVVTSRTIDYEDNKATGDSHTVTDGGVNAGQKVLNAARHQEGYGEYQAMTYFDTMMSMLGAPGGV